MSECKTEKRNSQFEHRQQMDVRLGCGSLSFLANEFDVRSVLHGQVSLPAVNHIGVMHEAMNGCKNHSLKDCSENVSISK